jgi:uncharacterized membrane-anchored protein YjiN (DUF445 family)
MERMPYDRIIVVSPSIKSNKVLMSRLKIEPEDIYENPDDTAILDEIKEKIEQREMIMKSITKIKRSIKNLCEN